MEILLALALLVVLAWFVTGPLRRPAGEEEGRAELEDPRIADLEARKEAKYREIRDAELDYRTGKLSEADWRRLDRELRVEAVELLRQLDQF